MEDLGTRYLDYTSLPPAALHGLRRYQAPHRTTGALHHFCVRTYGSPLAPAQMDAQRAIVSRLPRAESAGLCAMVDCRLEPTGHFIVSTVSGGMPISQLLRQAPRQDFAAVCDLLAHVAEALETATAQRWPRVLVDVHSLYLDRGATDPLRRPVKLLVPPLPGPEIVSGSPACPGSSVDYVLDLALLTCELLGMRVLGQNFRPLPQLGEEPNEILRSVIAGPAAPIFESAPRFVSFLRGGNRRGWHSTGNIASSLRPTGTQPPPPLPVRDLAGESVPLPDALPPLTSERPLDSEAPTVAVPAPQRQADKVLDSLPLPIIDPAIPLAAGLRLEMLSDSGAVICLCTGDDLKVGRHSKKNHHVTRLFPATPQNSENEKLISREHLMFQRQGTQLWVRDLPGACHSFDRGKPLSPRHPVGAMCRITVAGVYDLELRKLESWWPMRGPWLEPLGMPPITGAALLSPSSLTPALEFRTLWLFTDAAFGIGRSGGLNLLPNSSRDVLGWFLVAHKSIWVLASEDDGSITLDSEPLKAKQPMPLAQASRLRIGALEWSVSSLVSD